jgi:hypothetical protein
MLDTGIENVFFWINPVEKCTPSFPRCDVNRGKVTLVVLLAAPSIIKQVIVGCENAALVPVLQDHEEARLNDRNFIRISIWLH